MENMSAKRVAFTLVELLVVIAIIGILTALLLPAVQAARSAARRLACQNNMKQVGLAIHQYNSAQMRLPPAKYLYTYSAPSKTNADREETIGHNLITFLLPFLEQIEAYSLFNFDNNWQAQNEARKRHIDSLICPCSQSIRICRIGPDDTTYAKEVFHVSDYTWCEEIKNHPNNRPSDKSLDQVKAFGIVRSDWSSILAVAALNTRNPKNLPYITFTPNQVEKVLADNAVTVENVLDGLSNTFLLFECTDRPFKYELGKKLGNPEETPQVPIWGARWAEADDSPETSIGFHHITGHRMFNNTNQREIFSMHNGGCNFLFGDGSVRFVLEDIDPHPFVSFFTAAAGD